MSGGLGETPAPLPTLLFLPWEQKAKLPLLLMKVTSLWALMPSIIGQGEVRAMRTNLGRFLGRVKSGLGTRERVKHRTVLPVYGQHSRSLHSLPNVHKLEAITLFIFHVGKPSLGEVVVPWLLR